MSRKLQTELEEIYWDDRRQEENLWEIHRRIQERRNGMRSHRKKLVVAAAAALALMGTITAVAAGKIAGYYSSTNREEAILTAEDLEKQGSDQLGEGIKIAEKLSDGSRFQEGYVSQIQAMDEEQNVVSSYPEVMAQYGDYTISIMKEEDQAAMDGETSETAEYQKTYEGVVLKGWEDDYLFLPPDKEPSPEDAAREEAGELYISYGSEKEERQVFKNLVWIQDGFRYSMLTMADKTLEEMAEIVSAYIDGAQ